MKSHTNILLMRHGESAANADRALGLEEEYHHSKGVESDRTVPLTRFGYDTAEMTGRHIYQWIKDNDLTDKKITIIHSPYLRTIQTKDAVVKGLQRAQGFHIQDIKQAEDGGVEELGCERGLDDEDAKLDIKVLSADLIHEQEFGILTNITRDEKLKEGSELKNLFKKFQIARDQSRNAAIPDGGENRFHVIDRVRKFLADENNEEILNDPDRLVIIVSHGMTMRAIEKQYMELDDEWLNKSDNYKNCAVVALREDGAREQITQGYERLMNLPKGYKAALYGKCASEKLCLQR